MKKKEIKPINPESVLRPVSDQRKLQKIVEQEVKNEITLA